MKTDNQPVDQYSAPSQVLHWLTAIVVLVAFIFAPGGSEARVYSAARDFDRQLHETLGLTVLLLVMLRLVWRAFDERPAPPPMPLWMNIAAKAIQAGLYLLLFALPLTAIAGAWLGGHPLTLLGGVELPPVLSESRELGSTIAEIHTWLGDTIMWLAVVHAAAALFHHFVLGDSVLRSMLPRRQASNQ